MQARIGAYDLEKREKKIRLIGRTDDVSVPRTSILLRS